MSAAGAERLREVREAPEVDPNFFARPPIERADLERILYPIVPRDLSLYYAALTHASVYGLLPYLPQGAPVHKAYSVGHPIFGNNFEKLEFLGDSVIHLALASILVRIFPTRDEGFLSRVRINVEQKSGLAELCRRMHFSDFIKRDPRVFLSDDMLENVFEGMIGAMYEDQQRFLACGIQKCTGFIWQTLKTRFENIEHDLRVDRNFKDYVVRLKAKRVFEGLTWTYTTSPHPTIPRKVMHTASLECLYSPDRLAHFLTMPNDADLISTMQSIPVMRTVSKKSLRTAKTIAEAEQEAARELLRILHIEMRLI
jgi:dsRNA-specific ribonuclease